MTAPGLEAQARTFWVAASAMRGRARLSRVTAIRALIQLVERSPNAGLRAAARSALARAKFRHIVGAAIGGYGNDGRPLFVCLFDEAPAAGKPAGPWNFDHTPYMLAGNPIDPVPWPDRPTPPDGGAAA